MQGRFLQTIWKTGGTPSLKPRGLVRVVPPPRLRHNSSTPMSTANGSSASPAKKKPSFLVTHGEAIFRLILVSQATFGVLTVFWWHMHYFELQDEKNEEIAKLKAELKTELKTQVHGSNTVR